MSREPVFVLGHRGMLGHVVARLFAEQGYEVVTSDARYSGSPHDALVHACAASSAQNVINCIGVRGGEQIYLINGLLPQHLAVTLGPRRRLIHASSDGVFSGAQGPYSVETAPDALDPYGLSKRAGELSCRTGPHGASVVVVRTSIVGPELISPPRSLLGWLISARDNAAGYDDHLWNGITTLEWARAALRTVRGEGGLGEGVHQLAPVAAITKFGLLELIAKIFGLSVTVRRTASGKSIDRRLIPTMICPPIGDQLEELRDWYCSGSHK